MKTIPASLTKALCGFSLALGALLSAGHGAVPVINSIGSNSPIVEGNTLTLTADASPGLATAKPIRMAGIGANQGNRAFDSVFSSGDRAGSIARITEAQYNAMTVAQLRASYDVLLFTWASSTTLNGDWTTRLKPYLDLGGSIFWEDNSNVGDLAPGVTAVQADGSFGNAYTILPVPILTNGIVGSFVNHHLRPVSWISNFSTYITYLGTPYAIQGTFPSGGRMIVQGPDQDFHALRNGSGASGNQYKLILNQLDWLTRFQSVSYAWTGPNGFTATGPTPTIPNATLAAAGVYTVTVTNDEGNTATANTPVTVTRYSVANAGLDVTVNEGQLVPLNGSGSTPIGGPLTYAWTQLSGPGAVNLTGTNTATPSFTSPSVPAAGAALVFQLTVSHGTTTPSTDTVTVNVINVNNPPTPNAGPEQTVGENTVVMLNGSLSSDLDGDALTLHWSQVLGFGPTVDLVGDDAVSPTFTAPDVTFAQGTVDLKFQVVVNDGMVNSGPSTVIIHVRNTNDAPTANAGPNQSVNELDPVALNGAVSSDPDGNALTYSWTQILGTPVVSLTGANTATPSFTAPELTIGGMDAGTTLTFQLVVNDGSVNSTASTVNVRVSNVNHAPLPNAGDDQTVPEATSVALNGATSADVDGDTLTYAWVQTDGPVVTLSGTNTATASFTTPDVGSAGAVLKFTLTVDDGYGGTASDEVMVKVTYVNRPPTASAGAPQTVNEGTTATLAGTASDPDANVLAIAWSQVGGPAVTILNGSTLVPSFAAPLVTLAEDDVVLRLTVNDGYGGTASSDVSFHIANINHAPTAQAPANMSVAEGALVDLIGQGNDPDSEEQSQLIYSWQQIAPAVSAVYAGATLGLTAPLVTAGGDPEAKVTMTFRLTTTDPNGVSATDDVDVVVTNVEHAPTAVAGGSLNINEAASVTLNGSASADPDGDALTYAWVQVAGPAVTLGDANTAYPYFTAPFVNAVGATLKFKLTVDDGYGGTSSDCATVTVANINDAPIATNAQPSLGTLWPPDHSMVKVSINGIVDPNNNATITITGVTQDEATNGLGDGDTAIDAIINADGTVLLRAERSGKGNGRVYHIHFTATDFEGSASGVVKVTVPHSKKTSIAIDGGERFDSTH